MKKALVLLLVLAMLIPMVLVMPASALVQPANAKVTAEPFYVLGWSDFDEDKYPYLDGLVTSSITNIGENAVHSFGGAKMQYGSYTDADVTKLAEALKTELSSRPAGMRYWTIFGMAKLMKLAPEKVLFLDHSIDQLTPMFTDLINKMKEIGCPLDGVVIDTEYIGMGSWYLYANTAQNSNNYQTNKNIYAQIAKDKRYKTLIRPLLVERGFPFWPNPSGEKSEIYSICNLNKGAQYDLARSIWDTVMRIHLNNYANKWCYEPLKAAYPNVSLSDYQSHDSDSWLKLAGITDDGVALTGGSSIKVGNTSSFSYYYARPGASFFNEHKQYVSYNNAVYEASAFNGLLYDVNFTRHMLSSSDTKQIAPWITYHTYGGKKASSMAYTPYYTELLYHLGMFDPEPFLSYTYVGDSVFGGDKDSAHYHEVQKVHNEIMAELTRVAGYSDRKPIELPQYWNAEYVVSGMYANGRNIWRITPNTDEISLAKFKVKDSDPTFSVKGQTITFPGGKILSSATISAVGSCGYWVVTDAGVNPVMTSDKDRYAKYPSFQENFDSYGNGALNLDNMKVSYAWKNNVGANDSANIVASSSGKGLALTGNARFQNVTIPAKITAGDSYAENQTWEMTVTIPSGLAANAEITLLKYEAVNDTSCDGGILIKGGKVFYCETTNGVSVDYQEMTAIKPGTYTFKRVMKFSGANTFSYDLYLLDSSGKTVTYVNDIQLPTFNTINTINFFVKNADKAVIFDTYKLYPSGVTTDFELYDAATGINVKGDAAETPRAKSTAYRLSWLNGSDSDRTVTVMAAYYEGNTLKSEKAIKTLTTKPGCDGVETGIVEVKSGQQVKVYLKGGVHTENAPESETPATPDAPAGNSGNSDNSGNSGSSNKPTSDSNKATTATKPGQANPTKAPSGSNKASKATKATKPGQTLAPGETLAPDETLAPGETLAPDETLGVEETVGNDTQKAPKKSLSISMLILIISIVVAVLMVGGAACFVLLRKVPVPPVEVTETPETPEEKPEE